MAPDGGLRTRPNKLLEGASLQDLRRLKEATTTLLEDGGVFGKLNLVEGRWQDVFAEAVTESRVAGTQKASLERVVKSNPVFALRFFSSLSERLGQSDEVIESPLLHGRSRPVWRRCS